jgi:hypothetical protein
MAQTIFGRQKSMKDDDRPGRSKFKAMLIVFFDIQGIVMAEWVPSGQTVNQQYYLEVLTKSYIHKI